jgi:hypothetical protein
MKSLLQIAIVITVILSACSISKKHENILRSPNNNLELVFSLDSIGVPFYQVNRHGFPGICEQRARGDHSP